MTSTATPPASRRRRTSAPVAEVPERRWRLPVALAVVALLAGGALVWGQGLLEARVRLPGASLAAPGAPADEDRLAAALATLRRWDALRATAYAAGDPERLRALYVGGSPAAAADVRILTSYTARGLVVDRMRTQVLSVEPLELGEREIRLRVRDRLVGAEVVDADGRRLVLPRDGPTTRTLTFIRVEEEWRMGEVRQE